MSISTPRRRYSRLLQVGRTRKSLEGRGKLSARGRKAARRPTTCACDFRPAARDQQPASGRNLLFVGRVGVRARIEREKEPFVVWPGLFGGPEYVCVCTLALALSLNPFTIYLRGDSRARGEATHGPAL